MAAVVTLAVNCWPTVILVGTLHAPPDGAPEHASEIAVVKPSAEKSSIGKFAVWPAVTICGGTGAKQKLPVAVPVSAMLCGLLGTLSFNTSVAVRAADALMHPART